MSIKYSIIIPHFNSESSLARLLESIPNENYIEVIVVDDRSFSNDFLQVIEQSNLDNIVGFINNGSKGAGAARNIGVQKSKGEFVVFADADDYFVDNAFAHIDNSINSVSQDTDIVFFSVISENVSTAQTGFRHLKSMTLVNNYISKNGLYYDEKIRLTLHVPWGRVFRSGFLKNNQIQFDEVLVSNDVMFSAKAGKMADKIACFNNDIYCVTESENTLTTKKSLKSFWTRVEVYARYYNFLTVEEQKKIEASPLPFLIDSLGYGPKEVFKAIVFFKKEKVPILKYFKVNKYKVKHFFKKFF